MVAYIDWSDSTGLFDMLVEYVGDEKIESHADPKRERFLGDLQSQLMTAQGLAGGLPEIMERLKKIIASVEPDFEQDPVMDHLVACLEELERLEIK